MVLSQICHAELRLLVDFMYAGEVAVDQERLARLLEAARALKIKGLYESEEEEQEEQQEQREAAAASEKCRRESIRSSLDSILSQQQIQQEKEEEEELSIPSPVSEAPKAALVTTPPPLLVNAPQQQQQQLNGRKRKGARQPEKTEPNEKMVREDKGMDIQPHKILTNPKKFVCTT